MKKAVFGNDIAYYNGNLIRWIVDMPKAHLILPEAKTFERSDFKPIDKELSKLKAKHGIGEVTIYIGTVVEEGKVLTIKPLKTRELKEPTFTLEDIKGFMFGEEEVHKPLTTLQTQKGPSDACAS